MPVGWMAEVRAGFTGTNTEFQAWLRSWARFMDDPALDASVARHPAGKGLGRVG